MTRPLDPSRAAAADDTATPPAAARTTAPSTARDRAKAERRAALLAAAARLFAERGFDGVTLGDIGEAAGVSGPAVYRHVASKQALLGAILVDVSERLLTADAPSRPRTVPRPPPTGVSPASPAVSARPASGILAALVDFHVAFALAEADVIRVQDRDLDRLAPDDRRAVRRLQNAYVEVWTDALASPESARARTGARRPRMPSPPPNVGCAPSRASASSTRPRTACGACPHRACARRSRAWRWPH